MKSTRDISDLYEKNKSHVERPPFPPPEAVEESSDTQHTPPPRRETTRIFNIHQIDGRIELQHTHVNTGIAWAGFWIGLGIVLAAQVIITGKEFIK